MKYLFIITAIFFATAATAQTKPDSAKYVIVLSAKQLNELFYVIGTSGEISAYDIKKYQTALQKMIQEIPAAKTDSTKPSPIKKPK